MRLMTRPPGLPWLSLALLLAVIASFAGALYAAPAKPAATPAKPSASPPASPAKSLEYIDGVPDTGQFLLNSDILARVADRKTSVFDFRTFYFLSSPEIRSGRDSAGRAEFLTNLIRKDVLGLTALSAGIPLSFEDRAVLRENRATLLSNRLFETDVLNVGAASEDSIRKVYEFHKVELRMRVLFFSDRSQAEAVRQSVVKNPSTWAAQAERYNPPALKLRGGEIAWSRFENVPTGVALQLWTLKTSQISPVLKTNAGWQVFQLLERRPRPYAEYRIMKPSVEAQLAAYAQDLKRQAILDEAKQGMDVRYDTTNATWAAKRFTNAVSVSAEGGAQTIHIEEDVPEFGDADTARTILTWKDGRVSIGELVHEYTHLPAVLRPNINTPEAVMSYADAIMLQPRMLELAIARGLEKDPVFLAKYQAKQEEILVGKMVEDSCFTRITVSKAERRDYYDKNRNGFVTWPSVRYAVIVRDTKAAADSVKARLGAGETAAAILRADSLAGNLRSGTQEGTTQDHLPQHKLLFEELRPGQSRVLGPDKDKAWACFVLLEFDPGKQLPFEQVEGICDESVRNMKSEEALTAFVGRLMQRYPIEARYDLLMRVKLTTPGADEHD